MIDNGSAMRMNVADARDHFYARVDSGRRVER